MIHVRVGYGLNVISCGALYTAKMVPRSDMCPPETTTEPFGMPVQHTHVSCHHMHSRAIQGHPCVFQYIYIYTSDDI